AHDEIGTKTFSGGTKDLSQDSERSFPTRGGASRRLTAKPSPKNAVIADTSHEKARLPKNLDRANLARARRRRRAKRFAENLLRPARCRNRALVRISESPYFDGRHLDAGQGDDGTSNRARRRGLARRTAPARPPAPPRREDVSLGLRLHGDKNRRR